MDAVQEIYRKLYDSLLVYKGDSLYTDALVRSLVAGTLAWTPMITVQLPLHPAR